MFRIVRDWIRRYLIAADPHPEYSRLDHRAGLHGGRA